LFAKNWIEKEASISCEEKCKEIPSEISPDNLTSIYFGEALYLIYILMSLNLHPMLSYKRFPPVIIGNAGTCVSPQSALDARLTRQPIFKPLATFLERAAKKNNPNSEPSGGTIKSYVNSFEIFKACCRRSMKYMPISMKSKTTTKSS
jgi:hypothetical protein